jgi:tetratricopeptide (TPR) repeat protein
MTLTARKNYDRSRILEAAARAAAKQRRHEAIRCYRRVLVVEPGNPDIHRRIAPLLARTKQPFDAWLSFRAAARALLRQGQQDRALALYREAAQHLPRNVEAWCALARLEVKRRRPTQAFEALVQGSRKLGRRADRPRAIHLLRQALELQPRHVEATLELARLLCHSSRREEARLLLESLAASAGGTDRRRACAALLSLFPSLRHVWLWLRSLPRSRRPHAVLAERGVAAVGRVAPAG